TRGCCLTRLGIRLLTALAPVVEKLGSSASNTIGAHGGSGYAPLPVVRSREPRGCQVLRRLRRAARPYLRRMRRESETGRAFCDGCGEPVNGFCDGRSNS